MRLELQPVLLIATRERNAVGLVALPQLAERERSGSPNVLLTKESREKFLAETFGLLAIRRA